MLVYEASQIKPRFPPYKCYNFDTSLNSSKVSINGETGKRLYIATSKPCKVRHKTKSKRREEEKKKIFQFYLEHILEGMRH